MDRITEKDENGKYYIVVEKICIGTEQINPIKTWITGNENRGYGKPVDKLGKIEDLMRSYSVEDLEELNKLLGMATTYEELSKQIGCSLDVIATLRKRGFYDEWYCYISPYRICHIDIFKRDITYFDEEMNCFTVKFKDYKKAFWLKEDRSE